MQLCVATYDLTKSFPRDELYGLTSQMRRAAVSILSNIAEGHGRDSRPQLANFTSIARGSCAELEAQVLLARELGYVSQDSTALCMGLASEVGRMFTSMLRKFRTEPKETQTTPLSPIT